MKSLRVQIVLYRPNFTEVFRAVSAAAESARESVSAGITGNWKILLGDCSESREFSESQIDALNAVAAEFGGSLEYAFFERNLGHGGGHNRLSETNESDLLLVLNPDGVIARDCVKYLAALVNDRVAAADARQLPLEHPKWYDPVTGDQSWASGACMMIQDQVYRELSGFDHHTFFMYCDDVDLSWRMRLAGYRVVHEPMARMFHDKRMNSEGGMSVGDAERYYSVEAALLLAYKFSREDVLRGLIDSFQSSPNEYTLRALSEFKTRMRDRLLPDQIDKDNAIGQFISGNYALHRF